MSANISTNQEEKRIRKHLDEILIPEYRNPTALGNYKRKKFREKIIEARQIPGYEQEWWGSQDTTLDDVEKILCEDENVDPTKYTNTCHEFASSLLIPLSNFLPLRKDLTTEDYQRIAKNIQGKYDPDKKKFTDKKLGDLRYHTNLLGMIIESHLRIYFEN